MRLSAFGQKSSRYAFHASSGAWRVPARRAFGPVERVNRASFTLAVRRGRSLLTERTVKPFGVAQVGAGRPRVSAPSPRVRLSFGSAEHRGSRRPTPRGSLEGLPSGGCGSPLLAVVAEAHPGRLVLLFGVAVAGLGATGAVPAAVPGFSMVSAVAGLTPGAFVGRDSAVVLRNGLQVELSDGGMFRRQR